MPPTPAFSDGKVTVVFVLGGPGAGKGTQCERLVKNYGFVHLSGSNLLASHHLTRPFYRSAGDLLRAEQQREGSEYGQMIAEHIREGKIVPQEVTIALLRNAMREALQAQGKTLTGHDVPTQHKDKWTDGHGRFLIDGFPRKMDQAVIFDETVCKSRFVLFLQCSEEEMLTRLLERGKTSGRADDNVESIKKRFRTFVDTSMPVVDYYRKQDRVVEVSFSQRIRVILTLMVFILQVNSQQPVEQVTKDIRAAMDKTFA
ncbi:hypothetical protein IEQ34_025227 [Dendrobium chrysotoxum]|uniref:UMP-CMP kinase n=1 Tax=Dendrobium chrysotoxum TaxID=161865 RepID=A0AAV7FQT3_DENCH|nr:hypothetical protein IEQ34_025227 [Dendrobium chrysotoxum]